MTVRPVLTMGAPSLRRVADAVTQVRTPALEGAVADLIDTMRSLDGVGIAAPQIGLSLRIIIIEVNDNPRYPGVDRVPLTVLVNPVVTPLGWETDQGVEGCLSVPGMRGAVPRFRRVRYEGFDASGTRIDRIAEGFHARIVQHEVDHLDGVLFPDRMSDPSALIAEPVPGDGHREV